MSLISKTPSLSKSELEVDKIEVTVKKSDLFSIEETVFSEPITGKSSIVSSLTIDLTLNSYTLSESLSRGAEKVGGFLNDTNPELLSTLNKSPSFPPLIS